MPLAAAEISPLPPLARFAVVMMLQFTIPPLCRRARLPAVVGILAAAMLVGQETGSAPGQENLCYYTAASLPATNPGLMRQSKHNASVVLPRMVLPGTKSQRRLRTGMSRRWTDGFDLKQF
jgi:hypothetical protein